MERWGGKEGERTRYGASPVDEEAHYLRWKYVHTYVKNRNQRLTYMRRCGHVVTMKCIPLNTPTAIWRLKARIFSPQK